MQLTLEDIAAIHEGNGLPVETQKRLTAWIRTDAQFDGLVQELHRLADAAGLARNDTHRLSGALVVRNQLDALLAAEEEWTHPTEILDPDCELGLECEALLRFAEAGSANDPLVSGALERLRDAAEAERQQYGVLQQFIAVLRQCPVPIARGILREAELSLRANLDNEEH